MVTCTCTCTHLAICNVHVHVLSRYFYGRSRQTNHAALCRDEGSPDLSDKNDALGLRGGMSSGVNAIVQQFVRTPRLQRWAAEQENEADITFYP
jgi:hypothetical protein